MKKILLLLSVLMLTFSCSKVAKGEYLITVDAKGIANGKKVYLNKVTELGISMTIDSAKVKDGKFVLRGKANELCMATIAVEGLQRPLSVILESGEIDVNIDKDSIWKSKIGGTHHNDEFNKFNTESNGLRKKIAIFERKNYDAFMTAKEKKDTVLTNKISKEYNTLLTELESYFVNYPEKHKDSYMALVLMDESFKSSKFNFENTQKTFNSFDDELKQTTIGKTIAKRLDVIDKSRKGLIKKGVQVGQVAPLFTGKNPKGDDVTLNECMGKVTIVDFWASWCTPCRKENPNLVAIYNEFHTKGLNIVSISLDSDKTEWQKAIAKDKLTWTNISNLKEWKEPIALQYGVEQTPTTFILDASRNVVAKDLTGSALRTKIATLLK